MMDFEFWLKLLYCSQYVQEQDFDEFSVSL